MTPDISKKFVWALDDMVVSSEEDLEKEVEERDVNHDDGLEQLQGPTAPKTSHPQGYPASGLWG